MLLQLSEIDKRYGAVAALRSVSLTVRSGEVHAVVGENGTGKSTLVGVAAGTVRADHGSVEIRGERAATASPVWSRERGLAIVHQEPALVPDLTVAENMRLKMPKRLRPSVTEQNQWAAGHLEAWRDAATIDPRTFVRDLRPDERFVVEIACALAERPAVLILDEPTEHLLPEGVTVLFAAMKAEIERGGAVVYISHRVREVKQVADQVTVLRDGVSRGTHRAHDLTEDEIVNLIVGRELEARRYPPKRNTSSPGEVMLELRELSGRGFSPLSLAVREGEIVGLAGVEGQGQREIIRALAGLTRSKGMVAVGGQRVRLHGSASAAKADIVYLPNDRHREGLLPGLSVRENLTVRVLGKVARAGFIVPSKERSSVESAISAYAIKTFSAESDIESLSGGNQQKVMLGRTIVTSSRVILVDEPTQGVDVGARADIYATLRDAVTKGACAVMLSSDALELEGLCDRVLVVSRGHIVAELSGSEVTERNIVQAMLTSTSEREQGATRRSAWWTPLLHFSKDDIAPSLILVLALVILGVIATVHNSAYLTTRSFNLMLINRPCGI